MSKVVKGVLLGAAVGGTIVIVKALRSNEPTDKMTKQAATVTGAAAAAGAVGGFVLDRRARRKAGRRLTPKVAPTPARRATEHAAEAARQRLAS